MLRLTFRLTTRKLSRRTATLCDSRWFRLAIVVLLTCLLLPMPRVQATIASCFHPQIFANQRGDTDQRSLIDIEHSDLAP
jgi:hypothetical protein